MWSGVSAAGAKLQEKSIIATPCLEYRQPSPWPIAKKEAREASEFSRERRR
ncbi:hypothetical protein GCM10009547_30930 [Sporichthya brevicatena]|uniref:Uncharacterized protein n=1 Tax=Sporichthya brevicatena TaxID=171442 RepID=A0ABN1H0H9_9ACTN